MARGGSSREPVVLTARGRRVIAVGVALATTAAAVALAVLPGLGDDEPRGAGPTTGATTPGPTVNLAEPTADGPAGSAPTSPATAPTTPPTPPTTAVVVNGREQPPRVEPPTSGSGQLAVVPGTAEPGPGAEVLTYRVEVEGGLPFDGAEFAAAAHATLNDPRGWPTSGYAFRRVDTDPVDFRLVLASPALTDRMCAPLLTRGQVSCRNGAAVVLNALRWGVGIEDYGGDIATYREYLVNHEVGHRLGRNHPGDADVAALCATGAVAPVMMQQTYGLIGCRANAWPLPGE